MPKKLHAHVSGRVQGVSFRHHTARTAHDLGLTGWVRNLPDGRVELLAQGPEPDLERLAGWLRQGPPAARVDDVHAEYGDVAEELDDFSIRR